jgi:hypothetical protein
MVGRVGARAHAIRNTDSAIAITGQKQSRNLISQALNSLQTLQVADSILGHRSLPFVDAGEEWLSVQSDDLAQLPADHVENLALRRLQNLFISRSTQEAADEGAILRSTVRELVVDECAGKHLFVFAAWHQETKAGRQSGTDLLVVSQSHSHGRAVVDGGKLSGETFAGEPQQSSSGLSGQREDDGIEMVGLVAGGDSPATLLRL